MTVTSVGIRAEAASNGLRLAFHEGFWVHKATGLSGLNGKIAEMTVRSAVNIEANGAVCIWTSFQITDNKGGLGGFAYV